MVSTHILQTVRPAFLASQVSKFHCKKMKALLIISSLPDIIFIHADKGFVKHINKLSREAGFIGEDHNEDEIDTTALSQIFSPMITSLTYMNELGNPYSSILCEDGTLFVFRQVSVRIGSIFAILWVLHRRELGRNTGVWKYFSWSFYIGVGEHWFITNARLFTVPYFSVRSSRSSASYH